MRVRQKLGDWRWLIRTERGCVISGDMRGGESRRVSRVTAACYKITV
jgi:hypothetical protein